MRFLFAAAGAPLAALALFLAPFASALADDASRAAKMVELVENVNLPYVQRLFITLIEETRREMPNKFVEGIGVGAKLGPHWKPGNPHFDRARDRIEARIAESERQGRLEPPARREIAHVLQANWTEEDLDFLVAYVKTDTGKQLLEFMDTLMVPALRQALAKNSGAPPTFAARTEDVARQADERFRAISPTVVRGMQVAKSETNRAMALTKLLDSKSGEVVGQLWANKVMGEILAIGRDELLTISRTVDEFRRSEGLVAPPAAAPPARL